MIENYEYDECGVIKKLVISNKIEYNHDYANKYNNYTTNDILSHLRLGYVIGSIGRYPQSILDFGYGNASFLNLAKTKIVSYGYDITEYPLPEDIGFIENPFEHQFDVITFFDVIEHLENPYILNKLNCNYIVCSVPHCHYFDDNWFENWKHRRPDEHLWHFDEKSLINFFESQGFSKVNISNFEDIVRKNNKNYSNILSGVFKNNNM